MGFDVFLSHNSREKPAVERLGQHLKRAGIEPWLDKWHLTPGGRWQEELAAGLRESASCAVFIGAHDAGDWEREEIGLALDRAAKTRGFRVFLVLLPGANEPFDPNALSPFLSTRTWVDLRGGIESAASVQALVNAIKGVPMGSAQPAVESSDAVCPYLGLRPFDAEHATYYFGREREIQRLVEQLKDTRFLAVLGPSGSGKSSLVRAGLLPALRNGVLPGSYDWLIHVFTPGADPLTQLAAQFVSFSGQHGMHDTLDRMADDPRTLHLATTLVMTSRPAGARVVWVVDQFEEVFTLCSDETRRTQFIANLLHASAPEGRSVVIITLRADFYHRCAAYADLASRVSANQLLVGPMDSDALRQAIEEPARIAGLEFEEGLVATILEDVEGQPGALPLLEHSLLEFWERRRAGMLTLEAYRESGGVSGAIARRAETILASFDETKKTIVRRVLMRLTQIGEGTEDTRRRAAMSELVTNTQQSAAVEEVVRAWTDARLLTSTAEDGAERWVTVSHEALIRAWPRLRKWIDEDRAGQRLHRQITDASQEWQRLNRDDSALLRGVRLAQAREFLAQQRDAFNDLEVTFLQASAALERAEQRRRERARRQVIGSLAAGIIVALALGFGAFWQWRQAERERRLAVARGIATRSEVLRTQALANANGWAGLLSSSGLLAIEAHRFHPGVESARTLRAAADTLGSPPRRIDVKSDDLRGISPGVDRLAVAAADGKALQIWDLVAGKIIHTVPVGPVEESERVIFSPAATAFVVRSGSTISVWQSRGASATPLWTRPITKSESADAAPAFTIDEKLVAIADRQSVLLLDVGTGQLVREINHTSPVKSFAFSGDGRRLASAGGDTAIVLDVATGRVTRFRHPQEILLVAIDRRGIHLATIGSRHTEVWDATTPERPIRAIEPLQGSGEVVVGAAFDDTGSRLGITGDEGTGQVFNVASGDEVLSLNRVDTAMSISLNPRFLGFRVGGMEVWDLSAGQPAERKLYASLPDGADPGGPGSRAVAFAYSPDTARLLVVDDNRMWIYDTRPGTLISHSAVGTSKVWNIVSSGNGTKWIIRQDGGTVVADAVDGRGILWLSGNQNAVALSDDGRYFASAGPDDAIRVWDLKSGKELWQHPGINAKVTYEDSDGDDVTAGAVSGLIFSSDGERVTANLRNAANRAWELRTGHELRDTSNVTSKTPPSSLDVRSSNGTVRAVASGETVRITRVSDGQVLAEVSHDASTEQQGNYVAAMGFSPDGRFLVTGSQDKTARVWDLAGQEIARIPHASAVEAVSFNADGSHVTTAGQDGVRTWLWRANDLEKVICAQMTQNFSSDAWTRYFGTAPYHATCAGLPQGK
jgi:WD40 repeat protein/energy-coupling factor transporter ATP-binding protein EcfA2